MGVYEAGMKAGGEVLKDDSTSQRTQMHFFALVGTQVCFQLALSAATAKMSVLFSGGID